MNRLSLSLAAVALAGLSAVGAQSLSIKEFNFEAAEEQLKATIPFHTNLHQTERTSKGTRGYGIPMPTVARIAPPDPLPPPFDTEREGMAYYEYCGSDAIVRAAYIDSTPVLSSDKTLVYTISRFAIVDVIKSDVPLTRGQHLLAYRLGGLVADDGEKLQIDTPDSAAFEPNKQYILTLRRDKQASHQQYFIPPSQTIAVTNDKVYPISGRYAWLTGMDAFPSGSTYAAIKNTFAKVHTLQSCPDTR